jgi:integrase family protein
MKKITTEIIESFNEYLIGEEKSKSTITKYLHDVYKFKTWLEDRELSKPAVLAYKSYLCEHYTPASVNAALSSLNSLFCYMEWYDLRVKNLKIQKQIFASADKELTKLDYDHLLQAAKQKKNARLYLLMQTICSTGIRVSEIRYITVEAAGQGFAEINCKGKCRKVFLPRQLCRMLNKYVKEKKIKSGAVFVTKNGNPLDRSNIWSDMKKLCHAANVPKKKVFPHNLRHLFARTYYNSQKDIARLADILGHSNINTTRIYTMETGEIHRKQIQKLGLLRCYICTT